MTMEPPAEPTGPKRQAGWAGGIILGLVFLLGISAFYYFKVYVPKQQTKQAKAAIDAQNHTESTPLDESVVDHGALKEPTQPGRYLWVHQAGRTVVELTPREVRLGSVDDWEGLDPGSKSDLSSKRLFYVSYQLTYVNGDPIPHYVPPGVQLASEQKAADEITFMQMSGWNRNANHSGCQNPVFEGTFGKGSSLPGCLVLGLDGGLLPSRLMPRRNVSGPQPDLLWPVAVQPRR